MINFAFKITNGSRSRFVPVSADTLSNARKSIGVKPDTTQVEYLGVLDTDGYTVIAKEFARDLLGVPHEQAKEIFREN
jgi:hypothetical protein